MLQITPETETPADAEDKDRRCALLRRLRASAEGDPTGDHTWFAGYLWCFALCRGCGRHLGWHYQSDGGGDNFFGLIKDRLSSQPM